MKQLVFIGMVFNNKPEKTQCKSYLLTREMLYVIVVAVEWIMDILLMEIFQKAVGNWKKRMIPYLHVIAR